MSVFAKTREENTANTILKNPLKHKKRSKSPTSLKVFLLFWNFQIFSTQSPDNHNKVSKCLIGDRVMAYHLHSIILQVYVQLVRKLCTLDNKEGKLWNQDSLHLWDIEDIDSNEKSIISLFCPIVFISQFWQISYWFNWNAHWLPETSWYASVPIHKISQSNSTEGSRISWSQFSSLNQVPHYFLWNNPNL